MKLNQDSWSYMTTGWIKVQNSRILKVQIRSNFGEDGDGTKDVNVRGCKRNWSWLMTSAEGILQPRQLNRDTGLTS